MRAQQRAYNQLRDVRLTRHFTRYAEGSVLVEYGHTKVLCTASISERVPAFLHNTGQGWITAEYSMLPRATQQRTPRDSISGKPSGRSQEIQRLIARSLRAAVDLQALGERSIVLDCDVIQADGGTRTAAITGGCIALFDALSHLKNYSDLNTHPFKQWIAAVSVGMCHGETYLDLDYLEDSQAQADVNIVMTEHEHLIEVQGTAEKQAFSRAQLNHMLNLAQEGIQQLIQKQKHSVSARKL